MDKKLLIVANWKANKTEEEAKEWIKRFGFEGEDLIDYNLNNLEVAIGAPYTLLSYLQEHLHDFGLGEIVLSSQDLSSLPVGAYTGEIPTDLLVSLDVKYCLIGHSERRKYFGENNEIVEKKMEQALKNGITPIICAQSLEEIPENIRNYPAEKFIIMYEPFSAISTGGVYHSEDPQKVQTVLEEWKSKLNLNCMFLYGGSVNSENVSTYVNLPLVSGFVVGHASLEASDFFSIIKQCVTPSTSV